MRAHTRAKKLTHVTHTIILLRMHAAGNADKRQARKEQQCNYTWHGPIRKHQLLDDWPRHIMQQAMYLPWRGSHLTSLSLCPRLQKHQSSETPRNPKPAFGNQQIKRRRWKAEFGKLSGHHRGRLKHGHGDLRHGELLMVCLLCRDHGSEGGEHEVNAGVRNLGHGSMFKFNL